MIRALVNARHRHQCERLGHKWMPDDGPREFIPVLNICFRCSQVDVRLPTGECLGRHPIAEHYDMNGQIIPHPTCPGPQ